MRKLILLILSAFFVFSAQLVLSAEEPNSSQVETISVDSVKKEEAKLVTAIEIKGNKAISTNKIASNLRTRIGNPYQENVISEDLKRLYAMKFFSDIKIDSQDYKDGVKVIITVTERPIIEKVFFTGIERLTIKDDKLKGQLKSKEGQYVDYPNLDEDIQTIKKMYEKIGYNAAEISYKLDTDKETNKSKVTFEVVEGRRVHIKKITIEGNKTFTEGRIKKLLKTKPGWLFNAGLLKDEVFKEDIERIKAFYRRNGYMDVEVTSDIKPGAKKNYLLYITITVKEGNKYLVGNVVIQGNKNISEKAVIMRLAECKPGKVFSDEGVKIDVSNIQGLYFDKGYITAQIQDTTFLNKENSRVDINYNITENNVIYVDKIKVRGNVKTKDIVIRREMRLHPGDRFDGEKLRRSKERLQNLGFFEEISYDTEDSPLPDAKNLIVDVKETKTGSFSFGGGYSSVDDFVGFVEVEQKNFDWKNWPYFTGAGQDLKARASFGTISNGLDLSFTEPWLFDYPVSFGFDIYKKDHKRDSDSGYGYDESVIGGDLRLGKQLNEYLRGDLMYKLEWVDISNISDDASKDLQDLSGTNSVSSLTPSLTFDSRDNIFDPHKGNYITGGVEYAGGTLFGDTNFWKFSARASHYFPMFKNSTLELRGRVGLGEPFEDSDSIPIYDRFFAGGAYTIRGYDERAIGPVDPGSKDPLGGASMLIGNIEYVYPIFSFLKVAAFYDVGNVWQKLGDFMDSKDTTDPLNTGGLKSSYGLGLRIKTPIGPIMLDYGIPLDKAPGEDDRSSGKFHFSVSHGF
jgi:outer membrane protein insertion porin family